MAGMEDQVRMDKRQVAEALEEMAVLLTLAGENPFKARAYENAARALRADPGDHPPLGPHIAEKVAELVATGRLRALEELRGRFPAGVREMLSVPGLGPKKVRALLGSLHLGSLAELEAACRAGRLADLPGFGRKTQENILKGIASLRAYSGRTLAWAASPQAEEVAASLRRARGVGELVVAGSLRRRLETVKDIDLLATAVPAGPVMDALAAHPLTAQVLARGETKMQVRLHSGLPLDLRVVPAESFPFALQYFTGSREHNVALRGRALEMGYKLNEYGLYKGGRRVPCRGEEGIYRRLRLAYIPPELREDRGEIARAEAGPLPTLVRGEDLKGVLHAHTVASDGTATVEQMARAARELGYSYLGIAEHSRSARYARGLDEARVREQAKEIAALNRKSRGFRILHGIECDILPDGSLDFPDRVLAQFDFVIGSVHSHFTLGEKEQTARVCRALAHPRLHILGHPTGRLLLARDPYPIDMAEVLACAGRNGKAVEFNAHPSRLDLDWRLMETARRHGVPVVVCPDAHAPEDLATARWAVGTLSKGGATPEEVLNTGTAEQLLARFSVPKPKRRGGTVRGHNLSPEVT